jgi:Fe-S-cluster containining protein
MTSHSMIDLPLIASLAEPHWADNWNFRAYLQQHVPPHVLDQVAHQTYAAVAEFIDCRDCGQCCREIHPYLSTSDIERLNQGLEQSSRVMPPMRKEAGTDLMVFCAKPCPLLKDLQCTAYESRPEDCRGYPHLDRPDFLGGSVGFIENYGTCPLVFHTYSRLKSQFSYDPATDYIGDSDPEHV